MALTCRLLYGLQAAEQKEVRKREGYGGRKDCCPSAGQAPRA